MISRRDFMHMAAILGLTAPLVGCGWLPDEQAGPDGPLRHVVIVGAGAAGMSAAHLLRQQGVDFTILEAASTHGGRIKTATDFVGFPIPLGGEWIHVDPQILTQIVNDDAVEVTTPLAEYRADDTHAEWDGVTVEFSEAGKSPDVKFVGGTWLTFFEEYVLPGIESRLRLDAPVAAISYDADDGVTVTTVDGETLDADAVIVTVPLRQLQKRTIEFTPPLPDYKLDAIDDADIWTGMKVFIEFSEEWYPTFIEFSGANSDAGQKLYYDAAYGQDSDTHVLGLFTVGDQSLPYQQRQGQELIDYVLAELDAASDGMASRTYVQHIAQNWEIEPYIEQAYMTDGANWRNPPEIRRPLRGRVYFAGDAYTDGSDWSSVHMAATSAREAVDALLG